MPPPRAQRKFARENNADDMAFGAWLAGAIYDGVGFYAAAWWAGIAFNLVQIALVGSLLARARRLLAPR